MLKIKNYVKVKSIAEAYELNQKKSACVLGGMIWLKMGNRNVSTAIDLSGLGLDTVQEREDEFYIGCMTSLRDLETNAALNEFTQGAVRESLRHIVGVQFRNCATVGGSIFGRYGFSDVLTMSSPWIPGWNCIMQEGSLLRNFAQMEKRQRYSGSGDREKNAAAVRLPQSEKYGNRFSGADLRCVPLRRQGKDSDRSQTRQGEIVEDPEGILNGFEKMSETERTGAVQKFAEYAAEHMVFGSNMRASEEYRKLLAEYW